MRNRASLLILVLLFFLLGCSSDKNGLVLSDKKYDFGNIDFGSYSDQEFMLKNEFSSVVVISSFDFLGFHSSDFIVTTSNTTPFSIQRGGTVKFNVRFTPSGVGLRTSDLKIAYGNNGDSILLGLSGNGCVLPIFAVSETSYDFQSVRNGTSKSHKFKVQNIGTADLEISNISFTGTDSALFALNSIGAMPLIINSGVQQDIEVEFAPVTDGQYTANLEIYHNAENESSPVIIALDGKGVTLTPEIAFNQTSPWDFGTVGTINAVVQEVEIYSIGPHTLTIKSLKTVIAAEFTIISVENSSGNPISVPFNISVNDYVTIFVQFKPSTASNFSDILEIEHTGINELSPSKINLEAAGKLITIKKFVYSGASEQWTIPVGVTSITIEGWGAEGGMGYDNKIGGKGAYIKGTFSVTPGEVLEVIVGETGEDAIDGLDGGGGGGGSFITLAGKLILVAGGGGGGSYKGGIDSDGEDGSATTAAGLGGFPANTPVVGYGGYTDNGIGGNGAGGGGWFGAGTNNSWANGGAASGGPGGVSVNRRDGGYGGGGGSYHGGGGGGGYTGGNGGTVTNYGGGGGGSYNIGTNQTNTAGLKTNNGEVVISY